MAAWLQSLRAFAAPIADSQLPDVREHIVWGTRGLSLAGAFFSLTSGSLDTALGTYVPVWGPLYALAVALTFLAFYRIASTAWAHGHANGMHFALGLQIVAVMSLGVLVHVGGKSEISVFAPVMPLVVAAFAPWRPVYSLLLMVPAAVMPAVAHEVAGGGVAVHPTLLVFIAVMCGTVAAVASQLRRRVLERLARAQVQLTAAERMSALGRMTAGMAHELKTPLAAAATAIQSLRTLTEELASSIGHSDVTEADLREVAAELDQTAIQAGQGIRRAARFVQSIKGHTQGTAESTHQPFSVADRLAGVLEMLSFRTRRSAVHIETGEVESDVEMRGDPGHFDQILTNLLVNALDACEATGQGTVIHVATEARSDGAMVVVEDDGPGVAPEIRTRIFEPLFTTKAEAGGTGLGLTISRDLAESRFGGTLELVQTAHGARFELYCPRAGRQASGRPVWVPAQGKRAELERG